MYVASEVQMGRHYIHIVNNNVMQKLTIFCALAFMSCSQLKIAGTYSNVIDKSGRYDNFIIKIDKQNNYFFKRITEGNSSFSQGKVFVQGNDIHFIPDSTLLLRIKIISYSYDSGLGKNFKLVLHSVGKEMDSSDVSFYINNGTEKWLKFVNNQLVFTPTIDDYMNMGWLIVKVKRKNIFVPAPIHDSLISNSIKFYNLNEDNEMNEKPWNVLDVEINYTFSMFAFTTLPTFIYERKKLTQKSPIYRLVHK